MSFLPGMSGVAGALVQASGPPAYLNHTAGSNAGTASTSLTFSHTTTAATGMLVVLVQGADNGAGGTPTFSGNQTFDGVAMTAGPTAMNGNSGYETRSAIFYLAAPGAKTANVVITFSANQLIRVQAVNISNATALDTSGTDDVVTPLQVALNTTAPTVMFGVGWGLQAPAPTFTWSTGVVEIQDSTASLVNQAVGAGYRDSAAAESYTFIMAPSAPLVVGNLAVAAFK